MMNMANKRNSPIFAIRQIALVEFQVLIFYILIFYIFILKNDRFQILMQFIERYKAQLYSNLLYDT